MSELNPEKNLWGVCETLFFSVQKRAKSFFLSAMLILVRSLYTTCRGSVGTCSRMRSRLLFDSRVNAFSVYSLHRKAGSRIGFLLSAMKTSEENFLLSAMLILVRSPHRLPW
jgi:hypothetical protein